MIQQRGSGYPPAVLSSSVLVLNRSYLPIHVTSVRRAFTLMETIAAIIADEMAIGCVNNKTTAVRIIPAIGRNVGDRLEFGGLLGCAPVMPISRFRADRFVARGGRIPASLQALTN